MDSVLYHFTSRYHLPLILFDGFLKLTESNLIEPTEEEKRNWNNQIANQFDSSHMYKPVVWLSRNTDVKNNAVMRASVDKSEILITLRERSHYQNWTIWSKANRIKNSWAKRLTNGFNPNSWYISEQAISLTSDEVMKIENTKSGEILIDVPAGINECKIIFDKPSGIPNDVWVAIIDDRGLKEGDLVEFSCNTRR